MSSVLWLRRDLRRRDLPALGAAADAASDRTVLPLFVLDPALVGSASPARVAALRQALEAAREAYDGALVVRHGSPADVVPQVAREAGAGSVHVSAETTALRPTSRRPGPQRPGRARRAAGRYRKPVRGDPGPDPLGVRHAVPGVHAVRPGLARPRLAPARGRSRRGALGVARGERRAARRPARGSAQLPPVGEPAALDRWAAFRDDALADYADLRDRPDLDGTSQLSVQPEVRHGAPANPARRPRRPPGRPLARGAGVRHRARLAGVLRRRAVAPSRLGLVGPA